MSIWIVTKGYNAYDQYGDYFVAAYNSKPDFKQLQKLLPDEGDVVIGKLTSGGGRHDTEDECYVLTKAESGKNYHE